MKEVAVYLSNKEAEMFKLFLQYRTDWEEIFKTKEGSVKLNFDKEGKMQSVDYYKHKKVTQCG